MDIADLTWDERLALLGLMHCMVMADGEGTPSEAGNISDVAEAMGEDAYRDCLKEVEEKFQDGEKLKEFLKTIERPEAREMIYRTLEGLALSDAISHGEEFILDWVAEEWGIQRGAGA